MKVAVVGAGIAGLAAAHALQDRAEVTLFEATRRLGGHTDTHAILTGGRTYRVDSGFIVFNETNYPAFSAWLAGLGVASQPSDMSFAVSHRPGGLEYGTGNLQALIADRRQLASLRFLHLLRDLRRFYREAPAVSDADARTLGEYLEQERYSKAFGTDHMLPMCAALWSMPQVDASQLPVAHVVAFMRHHRMLQFSGRPSWRVVAGGSDRYVKAFVARFHGRMRLGEQVVAVTRSPGQVLVSTAAGREAYDRVVLACHSDQALALLADPSVAEREILGAIRYQRNVAVVHSDPSVMPQRRAAWSSWNVTVGGGADAGCQVSYWMNRLQNLDHAQPFFVTLNPASTLRDEWCRRDYAHPVFTREARLAQGRKAEISGVRNTCYAGAYWGWGFHEDGFTSGLRAAQKILAEGARAA